MNYYYEYKNTGWTRVTKGDEGYTNSGRFKLIDGEWVRIGEGRGLPDEPWCNAAIDWNDGVVNPMDGKAYKNKQSYLDAVKRGGGVIKGEDAKIPQKREIQGDFSCREELTQAVHKVLS